MGLSPTRIRGAATLFDDRNWKDNLLGCGLPLEFEVSRLLASKGLDVAADFRFARCQSAAVHDCSVDVHARAFVRPAGSSEAVGAWELLVECRPNCDDAWWLFLPDLNAPETSVGAAAHALCGVDHFSPRFIDRQAITAFHGRLPLCCKGVEIGGSTAMAADSDLHRGIAQLQYALPRLLTRNILHYLGNETEDNVPFLFCPILVTDANLLVAHRTMGVQEVQQSNELADLGDQVPYLVVCSDFGSEFETHSKREFDALERLARSENVVSVEQRRAGAGAHEWELPFAILESLTAAESYWLRQWCTRFVVCRRSALATLIDAIGEAAIAAMPSGERSD